MEVHFCMRFRSLNVFSVLVPSIQKVGQCVSGSMARGTKRGRRYFVSPFLHASRRHVTPIYSVTGRIRTKTRTFPTTIGAYDSHRRRWHTLSSTGVESWDRGTNLLQPSRRFHEGRINWFSVPSTKGYRIFPPCSGNCSSVFWTLFIYFSRQSDEELG